MPWNDDVVNPARLVNMETGDTMMFGILRFARYVRRVQENHKRALMARTFLDLPIELQKDIGWPADNASRKAARMQREINARPIL